MTTDYIKYVNDEAYIVKREIAVDCFKVKGENRLNMELVKEGRDYLSCNHVLRTQTHFLFCQRIEEAVIIEENAVIIEENVES